MKYVVDHDLHNHSLISPCSRDPRQTKEAIFAYAVANGFKLVALTDHFWDMAVDYQDAGGWLDVGYEKWASSLPLPQSKYCRFLMGAEAEMNRRWTIGMSPETMEQVDFFILSLTHLHIMGFIRDENEVPTEPQPLKEYYKKRLLTALNRRDLPFHKMGLAHFHACLIDDKRLARLLSLFTDDELKEIFGKIAQVGMGVELNFNPDRYDADTLEAVLRPYRIAKQQGCQFYFGGDAHHPEDFRHARRRFELIVDLLELSEDDKWRFVKEQTKDIQS